MLHHRDDTEHVKAHAPVGNLAAAGLAAHSFVDGLGIGIAFDLSNAAGFLVFIAVVTHDFADGMNTVSFVMRQGDTRGRVLSWLSLDALAPLAGAIVGSSLSISERGLGTLLSLYVGFFLFIGATDLLPEAHEHPSRRRVALTVVGFVATYLIAYAASR